MTAGDSPRGAQGDGTPPTRRTFTYRDFPLIPNDRAWPDETEDYVNPTGGTKKRLGIAPETLTERYIWSGQLIAPQWADVLVYGVGVAIQNEPNRTSGVMVYYTREDGQTIPFWTALLRLRIDGNPIAVERHFWPSPYDGADIWFGIEDAKDAQIRRAQAAMDVLDFLQSSRGRTGRKRLEESPSSPWRAFAEQARDLLASGEVRTVREAAERLMVDYDSLGDDSIAVSKAIRSAEVRLGGYLRKLRELDG